MLRERASNVVDTSARRSRWTGLHPTVQWLPF